MGGMGAPILKAGSSQIGVLRTSIHPTQVGPFRFLDRFGEMRQQLRTWAGPVAAGLAAALALATAWNMAWPTGYWGLGVWSLWAFTYTPQVVLIAIVLALVGRWRLRRGVALTGWILVGTAALVLLMALVPARAQWARAHAYDVRLSLREPLLPRYGSGKRITTQTYSTIGTRPLQLDVWADPDAKPEPAGWPAVVLVHGGGWTSGQKSALPAWDRLLADLGFVVLDLDYRLPRDQPTGWRPELEVGDVKCAIGWAAQHAGAMGIDPTRISVFGQSAGGNLGLLAGYTTGDPRLPPTCEVPEVPIRSVVSTYGVPDLAGLYEHTRLPKEIRSAMREYLGGSPDQRDETYALLSPITHVRRDVPPTLQIAGESDQLVPVRLARALEAALRKAGAVHDERYLAGADHLFDRSWGSFSTQVARAAVEDFLGRYG
jgi:acetyl esterase/lipase